LSTYVTPPPQLLPRREFTLVGPLRILASFSVVAHHMRGGDLFDVRFGLFTFLALMVALHVGRARQTRVAHTAALKFRVLLAPWLRWSAVYLAVALVAGAARDGSPFARLEPWMLATGGHAALWFLPFVFAVVVALTWIAPLFERCAPQRVAVGAALVGIAATHATSAALADGSLALPFDAWVRAAPLVPWGLALGSALRCEVRTSRYLFAALVVLACLGWASAPSGGFHEDLGRRIAVAVALLAVAFNWSPRLPTWISRSARVSFGVYLVHPLVAKVLSEMSDPFAWSLAAHAAVVWLLSAAAVAALARLGVRGAEFDGLGGVPVVNRRLQLDEPDLKAPAA